MDLKRSESIKELATALAKAQGELEHATKSHTNPFFNSRYATLADVITTITRTFSKHGLSFAQLQFSEGGNDYLLTKLMHSSGEFIDSIAPIIFKARDAQGYGSGLTYARRYSLCAISGISQEDDDGNAATQPAIRPQQKIMEQPKKEPSSLSPREQSPTRAAPFKLSST